MKKLIYGGLFLALLSIMFISCSKNVEVLEPETTNTAIDISDYIDFLQEGQSMLITPSNHEIEQTVLFTPIGKETSALEAIGFTVYED